METKIFRCKGEQVGKCMADRILQRKCKSCRFDACIRAGMRKDNLTKNVKKTKDPTKLDPGQSKLLEIALIFWRLYNAGVASVDVASIIKKHMLSRANAKVRNVAQNMLSSVQKLDPNIPAWDPATTISGQMNRMQHIMSIAGVHTRLIKVIAQCLPYFGQLEIDTKKQLLQVSTIELILLRASWNYDGQGGVRSINGVNYNITNLQQAGVSSDFAEEMRLLLKSINGLQMHEEYFAIIGIMCLLSPDRGENLSLRDRQQLDRLQEIFAQILRLRMLDNGLDAVSFAETLMVLTKLRSISFQYSSRFNDITNNITQDNV